MNRVELLSPAGSLDKLKIALLYGADAVYIGGREYSLRANAKNFSMSDINEACEFAHNLGKKVYVTVNIIFHNEDYVGIEDYLKELDRCNVDAIIVSELFIIDLVHKLKLNLDIFISTQNSVMNYEAGLFLKDLGVKRVVLGRETSKDEIKEIIDKSGIEVETFIHGAMCSSYSGRCVLSNYFTNRDANRGGCSQVCRYEFELINSNKNKINDETLFTMSCKDLSMITYIKDMIDIGITSFKIEGRMRSIYYIASVVDTYRRLIDDYYNNDITTNSLEKYYKLLDRVSNRESIPQFFDGITDVRHQYYLGREEKSNQDFLGIVEDYDEKEGIVTVIQKNYFKKGDRVEIFGPNKEITDIIIPDIYDDEGNLLDVARHPEQIIKFKLDKKVYQYDMLRIKI